jgi:selenocysteine-specific elongation factor
MRVVATSGHVDHGKSSLVRALTGTDPDRFAEEKERGLTIDLGFASAALPSGTHISFVDVPGHTRFLRNMLAGVGAVAGVIFVVAATEGWKPQSEEHLRILELLGHRHGVIALTKVGLIDDEELRELAHLDVEEHVEGSFLEGAEVVEVDSLDGTGLDDLRAAIDRLLVDIDPADNHDRPRLWVDRAFAIKGSGTVVTGTLAGGEVAVEDDLVLIPGDEVVRVRSLQGMGRDLPRAEPGTRTAANISGVGHREVGRGDVLVKAGQWHVTTTLDAQITVLESLSHEVSRRGAHVIYIGAGEFPCRLRVLGDHPLAPGETGNVRLYLQQGLPLLPGDRFVLREFGRSETVGGGEVLDVDPQVAASKATPDRSVERVVAERGWVDAELLTRLTGERREPTVGRWVVDPAALDATVAEVAELVDNAGGLGLDVATLTDTQRAVLDRLDGVEIDAGRARRAGAEDPLADHPFVAALEAAPFAPPAPADEGVDRNELRELVRRGLVLESDGIFFAPKALHDAGVVVAGLLVANPEGVTVADVRDAIGASRKYALPLLALLDGSGMTRRREDVRIAGPRLPDPT